VTKAAWTGKSKVEWMVDGMVDRMVHSSALRLAGLRVDPRAARSANLRAGLLVALDSKWESSMGKLI